MPLMHSNGMPLGTSAPAFSLPGVDGETHSLDSFAGAELIKEMLAATCRTCGRTLKCIDRKWSRCGKRPSKSCS